MIYIIHYLPLPTAHGALFIVEKLADEAETATANKVRLITDKIIARPITSLRFESEPSWDTLKRSIISQTNQFEVE